MCVDIYMYVYNKIKYVHVKLRIDGDIDAYKYISTINLQLSYWKYNGVSIIHDSIFREIWLSTVDQCRQQNLTHYS
jgi:hypothetical protein